MDIKKSGDKLLFFVYFRKGGRTSNVPTDASHGTKTGRLNLIDISVNAFPYQKTKTKHFVITFYILFNYVCLILCECNLFSPCFVWVVCCIICSYNLYCLFLICNLFVNLFYCTSITKRKSGWILL